MSILAAALHLYNGADHLEDTLYSLLKIKDLDVIHALDGAWNGGGLNRHSSDNSEEIFMKFREENETESLKFYYTYQGVKELWLTEGKKRNWLLADFENWYPEQKVWSLVIDADEEVMIPGNEQEIRLKQYLSTEKCGIISLRDSLEKIDSKPWYDSIRVIPSGFDYHYHTNKAMCIHNVDCDVVMDYEHKVANVSQVYHLDQLYFVNKGAERTPEQIEQKKAYFAYRITHEGGKCRYRKK